MILISDFVDMIDSLDNMPTDKLFILLSHHCERGLNLANHPLEFGIDLTYLKIHPLGLLFELIAFLVEVDIRKSQL